VESWEDVPSMDKDYGKAKDWLAAPISRLLEELKAEK
jgi:hypothetical protein